MHSFLIYENEHFRVEHARECLVPGYLIVTAKGPAASLPQLSPDALRALGDTLALATRAIEAVVRPTLVYCARFGEEERQVHFHLFPRTEELARSWRAQQADPAGEIHGPLLLDWARRRFHSSQDHQEHSAAVERTIQALRAFCANA